MKCSYCFKATSYSDIILTNSEAIHEKCLLALKSADTPFDAHIQKTKGEIHTAEQELAILNKVGNRILKLVSSDLKFKYEYYQLQLNDGRINLQKLEGKRRELLEERKEQLRAIYDYWPSRPPDWEERRRICLDSNGRECSLCGDDNVELHVHHVQPISSGGSHLQSNLELLCKFCHYKMHGGEEFSKEYKGITESGYEKKLNIIKAALLDGRSIHFNYRKYEGERSTRTIDPALIKRVGKSQCIEGYCHLRKATRVFAIKRMSSVKLV